MQLTLDEDLVPTAVRPALSSRADDLPLVELHTPDGRPLAVLPGRLQADVRTLLATDIEVDAELGGNRALSLRLVERSP